jgi:hypothetical protein
MIGLRVRRLVHGVLMLIAAGAATAGLAQQASFDGFYKGSIACESIGSVATFRGTLVISAGDGRRVLMSAPMFNAEGREVPGFVMAAGTVDPDGGFHAGVTTYMRDDTLQASYSGTFTATGGTLTGTEVWTRVSAEEVTRTCKGEFVRVEQPRK